MYLLVDNYDSFTYNLYALMKNQGAGRIVVVTHANENVGSVVQEDEEYTAAGMHIDVLPIEYEHTNEVLDENQLHLLFYFFFIWCISFMDDFNFAR